MPAVPQSTKVIATTQIQIVEKLNATERELARSVEEITRSDSWIRRHGEIAKTTPFRDEATRYQSQDEEHERLAQLAGQSARTPRIGQFGAKIPPAISNPDQPHTN